MPLYILIPLIAFGVLDLVILVVVVLALRRPTAFTIERSLTIAAPPSALFALVNDFHRWEEWSPWAKLDPDAKITFSGAASGVGASHAWDGNNKVGAGKATITEVRPDAAILIRLEFFKPFAATNTAEFTFIPDGAQTRVRWAMAGKNNLICRVMGLFMDMDKMVGKEFEKGLAAMKTVVAG